MGISLSDLRTKTLDNIDKEIFTLLTNYKSFVLAEILKYLDKPFDDL